MEFEKRAMIETEDKYTFRQSSQISMQTGLIGYLRADMDTDGNGFFSTWNDWRSDLKTDEFKAEFDEVINALREEGDILHNRAALARYCYSTPQSKMQGQDGYYGVRVDTDKFTYLLRLNPNKGEYNLYCYCYVRDWLDKHIESAQKGIRFIDSHYHEKFRIADGESVRITRADGTWRDEPCRYIDEYHLEVGSNLYHICEFAELMEHNGNTVIPTASVLPPMCYAQLPSTGEVIMINKGESGYIPTADYPDSSYEKNTVIVNEGNRALGVTKAHAAAMLAGSMFGWNVPAADPRNYDENGYPKPVRGNRFNAMSERYEQVEVCGQPAMFTSIRLDRDTLPKGMYMYEVRHADDGGLPCEIARRVMVNHFGTIITSKPIDLPADGHLEIDAENDFGFSPEGCNNLADFMKKYPPDQPPPDRKDGAR